AAPRALHSFPTRRSSDLEVPHRVEERQPGQSLVQPGQATEEPRVSAGELFEIRRRAEERERADRDAAISGPQRPLDLARPEVVRSEEHTSELQSQSNLVC